MIRRKLPKEPYLIGKLDAVGGKHFSKRTMSEYNQYLRHDGIDIFATTCLVKVAPDRYYDGYQSTWSRECTLRYEKDKSLAVLVGGVRGARGTAMGSMGQHTQPKVGAGTRFPRRGCSWHLGINGMSRGRAGFGSAGSGARLGSRGGSGRRTGERTRLNASP